MVYVVVKYNFCLEFSWHDKGHHFPVFNPETFRKRKGWHIIMIHLVRSMERVNEILLFVIT